MKTRVTPWIDLTLHHAQRCHHLGWFVYGCLEREQVLNLQALVSWWLRGGAIAPRPVGSSCREGLDQPRRRAQPGPAPAA